MLDYPFKFPKIEATFLRRINRFVVEVKIGNKKTLAYLPNPGRLWELLYKGTSILLVKNQNFDKLPYTVLACKKEFNYILLHTHLTNKIIKKLVEEEKLIFWRDWKVLKEEPRFENVRFDLLLQNNKTWEKMILEVKTCTLFGQKIAMFPDAETKRGSKHIIELIKIQEQRLKSGVLFVVMNPNIKYFLPAYHIDYKFSETLLEAKDKIEVRAIAVKWDKSFTYVEEIKNLVIPFKFLNKIEDKGIYLLLFNIKNKEKIRIGGLGEYIFKKGYYIYVGSAMNNLTKRIQRHLRKHKKLRWHIDYLLSKVQNLKVIPIRTFLKWECEIAEKLSFLSDEIFFGFGVSDCKCKSHLFYFFQNPLEKEQFQKLILEYRINKLEEELEDAFA